jgi:predicted transcriptional regulator
MRMTDMTSNGHAASAEKRQRETQAALDEVAAGRTVDHAEVQAWAAGFSYKDTPRFTGPECK